MQTTVYLSLGSNIGDREDNLRAAIQQLAELGSVIAISSLYETEPVEVMGQQAWFLNCAVKMETSLEDADFLRRMLAIELSMGRVRTEPKGPRTIDIDIVFWGGTVIDTPELTVPHPAMQHRRFVLKPLAEIAADVLHPVLKRKVQELLHALPPENGVVRKFQRN